MEVGLVRSLQPPDILWIHWRVYNSIANTSKWVLFLPSSDVRNFLYLLYTLIKLYYTNALSDQALSLALDWILLFRRPRIPASLYGSATIFHWVDRHCCQVGLALDGEQRVEGSELEQCNQEPVRCIFHVCCICGVMLDTEGIQRRGQDDTVHV